jgi:iron(III) transport system permease protein
LSAALTSPDVLGDPKPHRNTDRSVAIGRRIRIGSLSVVMIFLVVGLAGPILIGLGVSFWSAPPGVAGSLTFRNYLNAFEDPTALALLRNTLVLTIGAATLATVLGGTLAWIVTSTNIPCRRLLYVLPISPVLLPAVMRDMAWINLYSPRSGLFNFYFNRVFHHNGPVFNIYSMHGLIIVMGLEVASITYVILVGPFSALPRSISEASRASGAGRGQTAWRVVIPTLTPAVLSAFTLAAIVVAQAFTTPILIGLPGGIRTYMSAIYQSVSASVIPDYNLAAAQASLYLLLMLGLLTWYVFASRKERRFAVVVGRDYTPQRVDIGRWRWVAAALVVVYFLVAFVQLIGVGILVSLLKYLSVSAGTNPLHNFTLANYRLSAHSSEVYSVFGRSILLSAGVALATTACAVLIAFISLKSKMRFRRGFEIVASLPIATPPLVLSVYLLLGVLFIPGLNVTYYTYVPLVVACVIVAIPVALRVVSASVIQMHDDLGDIARVSGAGPLYVMRTVSLPLLRPALILSAIVVFSASFRELGAVILLVGPNTNLLPTYIFSQWEVGGYPLVSALNVLSVVVAALVLSLAALTRRRSRRRTNPENTVPPVVIP